MTTEPNPAPGAHANTLATAPGAPPSGPTPIAEVLAEYVRLTDVRNAIDAQRSAIARAVRAECGSRSRLGSCIIETWADSDRAGIVVIRDPLPDDVTGKLIDLGDVT